jgi:hypothetical protein
VPVVEHAQRLRRVEPAMCILEHALELAAQPVAAHGTEAAVAQRTAQRTRCRA